MVQNTSLEMLAFNVKMLGHGRKKRVLISAGQTANKKRMLPAIQDLLALDIELFATPGTHRFFNEHNIPSTLIHKISDSQEPNILSFLKDDRFDLVINILTGDEDYDASSDAKLIRTRSIENGIPLITDTDVGIATLAQIVKDSKEGTYQYKLDDDSRPWDLRLAFHKLIRANGGYANHHAHFDKAYLISESNLKLGQVDMQKKWELYRYLKENYTHEDLVERISRGLETFIDQGATYCRTMVDADSIAGLKPIIAAKEVQKRYADKIHFEIGVQPLEGVLDAKTFEMYEEACKLADYCGGLPSRDRPHPEKHLDVILQLAKKLGKPLDVHIDQE
ncbi:MAG: hydrolase, partial [Alphaproteobacteria bacterium]|nr:hydrolase [Alphaproteobacteria bacterium]